MSVTCVFQDRLKTSPALELEELQNFISELGAMSKLELDMTWDNDDLLKELRLLLLLLMLLERRASVSARTRSHCDMWDSVADSSGFTSVPLTSRRPRS